MGHTFVLSIILNAEAGRPEAMKSKDEVITCRAAGMLNMIWGELAKEEVSPVFIYESQRACPIICITLHTQSGRTTSARSSNRMGNKGTEAIYVHDGVLLHACDEYVRLK